MNYSNCLDKREIEEENYGPIVYPSRPIVNAYDSGCRGSSLLPEGR